MKYVKLTAKPNTWFKSGTEVYDYDAKYEAKKRITLDYWEQCKSADAICVCGIMNDGTVDGEYCSLDEFDVEIIDNL